MSGQATPVRSRSEPVKLAVMSGTSRCQAMTASTANSGRVWSQASAASASPRETRNCAASAPQPMMKDESRIAGKVQSALQARARATSGGTDPGSSIQAARPARVSIAGALSEFGHAGELEIADLHGRGDDARVRPVEDRGRGRPPDAVDPGQDFEDALVEAQVPDAAGDLTVLDQERPVAGHAGDDRLLGVHDAVVPE